MTIYEINAWTKVVDLIVNRITIINQMMGYGIDGCLDNPMQRKMRGGRYVVTWYGVEFASYGVYDQCETEQALNRLDALNDGIWFMKRGGVTLA